MGLCWFGDWNIKVKAAAYVMQLVNETWAATAEITEASVGLDHSQDTL